MTDLELVGTDELIAELQRRHQSTLIATRRDRNETLDESNCYWSGGLVEALGLIAFAKIRVIQRLTNGE